MPNQQLSNGPSNNGSLAKFGCGNPGCSFATAISLLSALTAFITAVTGLIQARQATHTAVVAAQKADTTSIHEAATSRHLTEFGKRTNRDIADTKLAAAAALYSNP